MTRFVVPLLVSLLIFVGLVVIDSGQQHSQGQSPTPPDPQLSPDQIKRVQEHLYAAGLDPGPRDGVWGPQTEAALRAYQQRHGLPVSGVLDAATRTVILAAQGVTVAQGPPAARPGAMPDAVHEAQTPRAVPVQRPEQQQSAHDRSGVFAAAQALPASQALNMQPDQSKILGFDFYRDPLNAQRPMQTFDEIMQADVQAKPQVMAAQRQLLERRYDLAARFDPQVTMSRGKPIPVGPTARLPQGMDWDTLAGMTPEAIRQDNLFPYPALPHPKQVTGGQVFPAMQIAMFPRLERFDVDFDLPDAFLPEFPPAIFLQSRPELGDVSRGEVVSINNFYRLFKDLLTPVQLDGLRLLLTPFPQEEFNPTDDRKSAQPSLGIACLDCHVNGHTTAQFHLNPDTRPQERRLRLDTTSLRGMFQQQIHGSKRSLRSVEDFTEFEQRTAYFNGDPIHAMKKGLMILDRVQVSHMAQMQNMFDVPPAPKLNTQGRLDLSKATESEQRGEQIFFGKGQCATCHTPPFYLDHQMHDLRVERFVNEAPLGPIKTFTLRGIKESPPYLHDGRCLTLEDTVEFFNLVLELKLSPEEKRDLVAFMKVL
jgi:cytochrome c peroxidase/peptidoglycan hydrolase-like protein with peptidoglycan-binding domain